MHIVTQAHRHAGTHSVHAAGLQSKNVIRPAPLGYSHHPQYEAGNSLRKTRPTYIPFLARHHLCLPRRPTSLFQDRSASMSSRKRSRETDLVIKIASGDPLQADSLLVRGLCDNARGLPAAAEEWDVSGLLLDGQPFSRETVSCWLSCVYSVVDGLTQLGPQDIEQLSTVTGLTQLLAFADAVGSSVGLLNSVCSQVQQLKFKIQLPEQHDELELPVAEYTYWFSDKQLRLARIGCSNLKMRVALGGPLASEDQIFEVRKQVAKQTAALLYKAHVLRLQPLLTVLHQFIRLNTWMGGTRLLSGVMGLVFSDAVLEAALGSSTLSKEAYISSVLSQPCSLTPGSAGHSSLLEPVGPRTYDTDKDVLKFNAQLLQDFADARSGDLVRVELDLFGTGVIKQGTITIRSTSRPQRVDLPVQLLLGSTIPCAACLEEFLTVSPPAPPTRTTTTGT